METDSDPGLAAAGAVAGAGTARPALDYLRWLRGQERGHLADLLHDGPVQQLAVATLQLSELRDELGPSAAEEVDAIARHVEAAGRSLRRLQDTLCPFPDYGSGLAAALQARTAWLPAGPLTVTPGPDPADLPETDIQALADLVELIIARLASTATPPQAHAQVHADQHLIAVTLDLTPPPAVPMPAVPSPAAPSPTAPSPAADHLPLELAWLPDLAAAIQARAHISVHGRAVRVRLTLPRSG